MTWRARAGCPPPGAVPVTVTDPGGPRAAVAGWASGHTTALICWRGQDGAARPGDPGGIVTWTRTVTDERDVVMTLASLGQHDNVELVGAWLLTGLPEGGAADIRLSLPPDEVAYRVRPAGCRPPGR